MPDPVYEFVAALSGVAQPMLRCRSCGALVLADQDMATVIATDPDQWASQIHTEWHQANG